ncbi:MAG: paraquat-inducible protein A, partial [Chitinophagales bacterium]|nr:paraquat-inducible protein A [Chitinophagales bacterium]
VDAWRNDIVRILAFKIDSFSFSPEQEDILKKEISGVLNKMISEAERMVNDQTTFSGKIKSVAINTFVDWDEMRKKIPGFSQLIMDEIKKPGTRESIKDVVNQKLNEYATQIYEDDKDTLTVENIYAKYDVATKEQFNIKTELLLALFQDKTYQLTYAIVCIMAFILLLWFVLIKYLHLRKLYYTLCVIFALIVLVIGITSPMIEIDARIENLDFSLLGDHLNFNDQVLFLESKSILDVVHILLKTEQPDSMLVGALIFVFSVLFPVAKLMSAQIYMWGNKKTRENRVLHYLAFKSGKWSMADVMVVAIFMAYVGFKGILDDQLRYLNVQTTTVTSLSTNDTSLQPGFIVFTGFVLFGLVLSEVLKRIIPKPVPTIKINE